MPNAQTEYRRTARLLHWGMAVLVLATIPAGFVMRCSPISTRLCRTHCFSITRTWGVLLLLLVVWRAIHRWRHPPAPLPADVPGWQRGAAGLTHMTLYALLIAMARGGIHPRQGGPGFPDREKRSDWLLESRHWCRRPRKALAENG